MATPLRDLITSLAFDEGARADFDADPGRYLDDHGWSALDGADLRTACGALVVELPIDGATALHAVVEQYGFDDGPTGAIEGLGLVAVALGEAQPVERPLVADMDPADELDVEEPDADPGDPIDGIDTEVDVDTGANDDDDGPDADGHTSDVDTTDLDITSDDSTDLDITSDDTTELDGAVLDTSAEGDGPFGLPDDELPVDLDEPWHPDDTAEQPLDLAAPEDDGLDL